MPPNCRALGQYGSDHQGVYPVYYFGFQTWSFTKCDFTGSESPVGIIQHIFKLCLRCQSLVQNKSKVLTWVVTCNVCSGRVGSFRPLESLYQVNNITTIFCGLIHNSALWHHCCTTPKATSRRSVMLFGSLPLTRMVISFKTHKHISLKLYI